MRFEGTEGYVATDDLKVAVNAAITLERPLLVKGEPGTGKTVLALEIAKALGAPLIEWHIKSTTKAQQGLYEYDAVSRLRDGQLGDERVHDIANYIVRGKLWDAFEADHQTVVLIDEMADLMMSAPDQTEPMLIRLAQLARATGIHLVVATQRPSTDVVTGLIKANFPARISFAVASSVDSRVILDTGGAESLLGHGDMLFMPPEVAAPIRVQGVMVSDPEIDKLIMYWQTVHPVDANATPPWEELLKEESVMADRDDLVNKAIKMLRGEKYASTSMLQRRLRIGYPRAARLMDELEEMGIVGPSQTGGREREVLVEGAEEEVEEE